MENQSNLTNVVIRGMFDPINEDCPVCDRQMYQGQKESAIYKDGQLVGYGEKAKICKNCFYPVKASDLIERKEKADRTALNDMLRQTSIGFMTGTAIVSDIQSFNNLFENFNADTDELKRFKQNMISEANDFAMRDAKKLFITGKTGTGKTHISMATAWYVLMQREYRVHNEPYLIGVVNWPEYLRQSKQAMNGKETAQTLATSMRRLQKARFVILDDLGAESRTLEPATEYVTDKLTNFADRFGKRSMIITSNYTGSELQEKYGSRAIGRLFQGVKVIRTDGLKDYRMQFENV